MPLPEMIYGVKYAYFKSLPDDIKKEIIGAEKAKWEAASEKAKWEAVSDKAKFGGLNPDQKCRR